jgi:hypothetical protein
MVDLNIPMKRVSESDSNLDQAYDASDPYDQVALIFGIFVCERCSSFYSGDPASQRSLPYHIVGQGARKAGWLAEPLRTDYRGLCPSCQMSGSQIERTAGT